MGRKATGQAIWGKHPETGEPCWLARITPAKYSKKRILVPLPGNIPQVAVELAKETAARVSAEYRDPNGEAQSAHSPLDRSEVLRLIHKYNYLSEGRNAVKDGYVYAIRIPGGTIKIGWSRNLVKRRATLQTSHPEKLEIIGTLRGSIRSEKIIQDTLQRYRVNNPGAGTEFFWENPVVIEFLYQLGLA